jgi:hypothetical protein
VYYTELKGVSKQSRIRDIELKPNAATLRVTFWGKPFGFTMILKRNLLMNSIKILHQKTMVV